MNPRNAIQQAVITVATLAAATAWGHPNHADAASNTTLLHLLTEPDHLLMLFAAVGVGVWAVRRGRNKEKD